MLRFLTEIAIHHLSQKWYKIAHGYYRTSMGSFMHLIKWWHFQ